MKRPQLLRRTRLQWGTPGEAAGTDGTGRSWTLSIDHVLQPRPDQEPAWGFMDACPRNPQLKSDRGAQTGLASHVEVGPGAVVLAKAGVNAEVTIGKGAVVFAGSMVFSDVAEREQVLGYPARPRREALKRMAAGTRIRHLRGRIEALENTLTQSADADRAGSTGKQTSDT